MQYASVDGQRVEARPGLSGQCPVCGSPVIARCGEIRVHHWAHRGERKCVVWWETETAWHREWKGHFPEEWREFVQHASDGEKHIAAIRSLSGHVVEFQHSFLNPDERRTREAFYGEMLWVVNGMRRQRDRKRFVDAIADWKMLGKHSRIYITPRPTEGLPTEWLDCSKPVYLDFGDEIVPDTHRLRQRPAMWCLLPARVLGYAVVVEIGKAMFIDKVRNDAPIFDWRALVGKIESHLRRQQLEALIAHAAMVEKMSRFLRSRPRPPWIRKRPDRRY